MTEQDYCFAHRNGYCEAMKDPHCPGYDVCPFYKKRSVWEEEWGESAEECFAHRRHLEEGDKEDILKMRAEGVKVTEIAEILGVNEKSVYNVIAQNKPAGRTRHPRQRITDERRQQVFALRAGGMTITQISTTLGMAKSTVWGIVREEEK